MVGGFVSTGVRGAGTGGAARGWSKSCARAGRVPHAITAVKANRGQAAAGRIAGRIDGAILPPRTVYLQPDTQHTGPSSSWRPMPKYPVTLAVRALRAGNVAFEPFTYAWEPQGGTRASAEALGVNEHVVVKTLIFEDEARAPLCVLMHGDREVSAKQLARLIDRKTVGPCAPDVADRHSGYQVGGTSPFGLRRAMPIYMQSTIADLPRIYINGGARGFVVAIDPQDAVRVLKPTLVDVAVTRG
jgi:Cys-tRNA(Pro) deacylase